MLKKGLKYVPLLANCYVNKKIQQNLFSPKLVTNGGEGGGGVGRDGKWSHFYCFFVVVVLLNPFLNTKKFPKV